MMSLEPVEGAGQRRAEGAGDTADRTATDQHAKVGPPQPKGHADARRHAAGKSRVAGLEPNRSPDKRTPGSSWKSSRCSTSTPVPMAVTTKPAMAPTTAASAMRLTSRPAPRPEAAGVSPVC